jgi:hypothetical protein
MCQTSHVTRTHARALLMQAGSSLSLLQCRFVKIFVTRPALCTSFFRATTGYTWSGSIIWKPALDAANSLHWTRRHQACTNVAIGSLSVLCRRGRPGRQAAFVAAAPALELPEPQRCTRLLYMPISTDCSTNKTGDRRLPLLRT